MITGLPSYGIPPFDQDTRQRDTAIRISERKMAPTEHRGLQ